MWMKSVKQPLLPKHRHTAAKSAFTMRWFNFYTIFNIVRLKRKCEWQKMNQIIKHLVSESSGGGKLSCEYFIARISVLADRLAQPIICRMDIRIGTRLDNWKSGVAQTHAPVQSITDCLAPLSHSDPPSKPISHSKTPDVWSVSSRFQNLWLRVQWPHEARSQRLMQPRFQTPPWARGGRTGLKEAGRQGGRPGLQTVRPILFLGSGNNPLSNRGTWLTSEYFSNSNYTER